VKTDAGGTAGNQQVFPLIFIVSPAVRNLDMIYDVILNLIEKAMSIYLYNSQSSYAMTQSN